MVYEPSERARRALSNSPIYALRLLEIDQVGDSLVISGRVETYYQKQLAQEIVRHVVDECDLVNSVRVD